MAAKTPLNLVGGEVENFQSGDFVAIANGGTGATTQVGAQTALGLIPRVINVRVASTGSNVSVSSAPATLDGITLVAADVILLKDQTTGSENGAYTFTSAGTALTRSAIMSVSAQIFSGLLVTVSEGSINYDSIWSLTSDGTLTLGTTSLVFSTLGGNAPSLSRSFLLMGA